MLKFKFIINSDKFYNTKKKKKMKLLNILKNYYLVVKYTENV